MLPPPFCNSSLTRASINNLGKFSCFIVHGLSIDINIDDLG